MKFTTFLQNLFRRRAPKTAMTVFKGDGQWCFYAVETVEQHVALVNSRTHDDTLEATWYGGTNDTLDSGRSASGVHTKDYPRLCACALPMDLLRTHNNPCKGSPIPILPWGTVPAGEHYRTNSKTGTIVRVTNVKTGANLDLPLNDLGPAKSAGNAIDLTQTAYKALGTGSLRDSLYVKVTILNGMQLFRESFRRNNTPPR